MLKEVIKEFNKFILVSVSLHNVSCPENMNLRDLKLRMDGNLKEE